MFSCNNLELNTDTAISPPSFDYDWVTARIASDLPIKAKAHLDGFTESYRDGICIRSMGNLGPDFRVLHYPGIGEVKVTGSPHKHLRTESVGVFGTLEMADFVSMLSDKLAIDADIIMAARVSRFDIGLNSSVEADVADYLRLMSPPSQMWEIGSGPSSKSLKNSCAEIILYDKVRKIEDRKLSHAIPNAWHGSNWLRIEVRFKKPKLEFGRTITVADLCDPVFHREAIEKWKKRVHSIQLDDGTWPVPLASTPTECLEIYAESGIHSTGGYAAAIERVNQAQQAGIATSSNASRMRKMIRGRLHNNRATMAPSLADEIRSIIKKLD